jgi:hypothetical protein
VVKRKSGRQRRRHAEPGEQRLEFGAGGRGEGGGGLERLERKTLRRGGPTPGSDAGGGEPADVIKLDAPPRAANTHHLGGRELAWCGTPGVDLRFLIPALLAES